MSLNVTCCLLLDNPPGTGARPAQPPPMRAPGASGGARGLLRNASGAVKSRAAVLRPPRSDVLSRWWHADGDLDARLLNMTGSVSPTWSPGTKGRWV